MWYANTEMLVVYAWLYASAAEFTVLTGYKVSIDFLWFFYKFAIV